VKRHRAWYITRSIRHGALFARNPWNIDFGDHVAFADPGCQTA
jgi:hypothetical protein